eukprot:TRINITY_DN3072_c0_g1_i1.p1 TRINITY_DN3072_c0_g1~~TRINITY_DN3072_c0_g1_i1.p1  ORF type:complete len:180 (-),score=7.18 TRINITY_DN3072_c0_g1_i1:23-562(-)
MSVLQMYHCSQVFRLVRIEDLSFLRDSVDRKKFRDVVSNLFLASDLKNHFKYIPNLPSIEIDDSTKLQYFVKLADMSFQFLPLETARMWINQKNQEGRLYNLTFCNSQQQNISAMKYIFLPYLKSFESTFTQVKLFQKACHNLPAAFINECSSSPLTEQVPTPAPSSPCSTQPLAVHDF